MLRVLLGLIKGGVVGAGVGFLAWKLGVGGGVAGFVVYGVIAGLAGIVAGRAPWKHETFWTPLLKGIFGFGIGLLLYWGGRKLLGGVHLGFATGLGAPDRPLVEIPFLLGPIIGAVFGILVEVDDSVGGSKPAAAAKPEQAPAAPPGSNGARC